MSESARIRELLSPKEFELFLEMRDEVSSGVTNNFDLNSDDVDTPSSKLIYQITNWTLAAVAKRLVKRDPIQNEYLPPSE